MLDTIILKGDNLTKIRQFYNLVNTAIMTSLASMEILLDYDELKPRFDYYDRLILPTDHTQYKDANNQYKQ